MRSPSYLALLSFLLLPFLSACAQEEPLLEAKSSFGSAAEPLILCFNGQACTSTKGSCSGTGTCNSSGACIVSSWCNDNNVCTTDSCLFMLGSYRCVNTGAPSSTSCNDNSACTTGDHCNGSGTCIGGSTVNCADTNPCTNDSCLPASGCTHTNTSSGTSCTDSNACTSGDVCNGYGSCVGSTVVCNDGNSCTTDSCNSGLGCVYTFIGVNYSCNDNLRCTTNDRCNASQQCLGTSVTVPSDGNPCTFDKCDPATGNFVYPPNNGASCSDNNACTVLDACYEGTCVGYSRDCNDGNACTNDNCVPQTGCVYTALVCTDTNPCTDNTCVPATGCSVTFSSTATSCNDGDLCTTGDHCNGSGSCISTPVVPDDDNNFCTLDICNPAGPGTLHSPTNQGLACNDNNACTTTSTCNNGTCVGGASLNCNDGNSCTTDSCNSASGCVFAFNGVNSSCNDNLLCTTNDKCNASQQCAGTAVTVPPDGNPCTFDQCDPATGSFVYPKNDGASCNDGNACSVGDSCNNKACTVSTPRNCDDTNACTTDSCNISSGCVNTAIVCNDNNQCTSDSCSSAAGCVYTVTTGALCNDGNACTTGETCNSSKLCGQGTPVIPQNDNNPCTADLCVSANGTTSHTPTNQGMACNDNNACTVTSACAAGVCQGVSWLNCNDGNICTDDSCNPATGCSHANNSLACNDNSLCTVNDQCNGFGSCTGADIAPADDGNPCTVDTCVASTGLTTHVPGNEGISCATAVPCTDHGTCQAGQCTGIPMTCADGDACTVDSCDVALGCQHAAKDCSGNNACKVYGCNTQTGCTEAPKDIDDHNSCTTDICHEAAGQFHEYIGDGEPCDDGNAQTNEDFCGESVCKAGLSCQPAVLTTLPQPVPPPIVRRRLGRGRHVVATSDKGQAVVFVEELTEKGGSINVGVATFTASGVRTGAVSIGNVPFYADPVIAALPNGDYVVGFDSVSLDGDGLAVGLVKVSANGQVLTQPILANTAKAFGQHSADIIWTGTELRVAWEDESEPGHRKLCQRRFNEDLSPLSGIAGEEDCGYSAPEYDRSRVSLATVGQSPVTAWQETWQETEEPFTTKRRVQLRIGAAQASFDITAAPQDESPAVVELDASHVLMVYPDTDGTQRAVVVDTTGNVVDNTALNEAGEPRYTPVLTKIGEQVYMAWMSPPALLDGGWDPDLDDVFVQKLAWNQGTLDLNANAKFPIPYSEAHRFGDQRNPALAPRLFNGKNAMWTAWEDLSGDKSQTNHGEVLVSIRVLP